MIHARVALCPFPPSDFSGSTSEILIDGYHQEVSSFLSSERRGPLSGIWGRNLAGLVPRGRGILSIEITFRVIKVCLFRSSFLEENYLNFSRTATSHRKAANSGLVNLECLLFWHVRSFSSLEPPAWLDAASRKKLFGTSRDSIELLSLLHLEPLNPRPMKSKP